ncbi:MAG: hypothetical protein HRS57_02290, partial [Mycoplasmataceae bacterium]|nr:hypothetical protein [Mycoplasmataceae bacterium]
MEYRGSKSKKIVIFSFVGIVVAAAVGLTLFFVLSDNEQTESIVSQKDKVGKVTDAGADLVYWEQGGYPVNPSGVVSTFDNTSTVTQPITTSTYSYYAVDEAGNLYTWGDNQYGQLGHGTDSSVPVTSPKIVDLNSNGILDSGDTVSAAGMSFGTSWAIQKDTGYLYTWGRNDYGQLGYQTDSKTRNSTPNVVNISDLNNEGVIDSDDAIQSFEIADGTSIALSNSNYLYSWGYNSSGSLGRYMDVGAIDEAFYKSEPIDLNQSGNLSDQDKVVSYGLGSTYSPYDMTGAAAPSNNAEYNADTSDEYGQVTAWAINQDGYLYMWGNNEYYQIQNNVDYIDSKSNRYVLIPTLVNNLNNAFTGEIQLYEDVTVSSGVTIFEKQKMDGTSDTEFYVSGSDKYWVQGKFTGDNNVSYVGRGSTSKNSKDTQIYSNSMTSNTQAAGITELSPSQVFYPEYSGTLMIIDDGGNLFTIGN